MTSKTATDELLRRAAAACEDALRRAYQSDRILFRFGTAAGALDTPPETLRSWIKRGLITPTRIGRNVYIAKNDLLDFVERHRGESK